MAAGCAAGTTYLYFPGKEDLFHAIVTRHVVAMGEKIGGALESDAAPLNRLKACVAEIVAYFNQHRTFFRILYTALPGGGAHVPSNLRGEALAAFQESRRRRDRRRPVGPTRRIIRKDLPAEELVDFMHGVNIVTLARWALSESPLSRKEQVALLWGLELGGLLGPGPRGDDPRQARRLRTPARLLFGACQVAPVCREQEKSRVESESSHRAPSPWRSVRSASSRSAECEAIALENNLEYRVTLLETRLADEDVREALASLLPAGSAEFSENRRSNDPLVKGNADNVAAFEDREMDRFNVGVLIPIFDFGATRLSYQIAKDVRDQQRLAAVARARLCCGTSGWPTHASSEPSRT